MALTFDITAAEIVGLFMECILYGVYLVSLGFCLRALLLEQTEQGFRWKKNINWIMLVVSLLLCLFATLDVAFGLRHNLDAFVYYKGPGGAAEEFENISYWVDVMQTVDYVAQTCIGDGMLIYRCYIVFGKNWKIILPSVILWLGGTVCGALLIWTFATLKPPALIDTSQAEPYTDVGIALSLTLNVITTALIVWRIWSIDRESSALMTNTTSSAVRASKLHKVMRIIVDSAALYTLATVIFVITYITGSNANYGTSDNVIQIIGISFNLIIIRVDAEKSYAGSTAKISADNDLPSFQAPALRRRRQQNSFPFSLLTTTVSDQTQSGPLETELTTTKSIILDVEVVHGYGNQQTGIINDAEPRPNTDYP